MCMTTTPITMLGLVPVSAIKFGPKMVYSITNVTDIEKL